MPMASFAYIHQMEYVQQVSKLPPIKRMKIFYFLSVLDRFEVSLPFLFGKSKYLNAMKLKLKKKKQQKKKKKQKEAEN